MDINDTFVFIENRPQRRVESDASLLFQSTIPSQLQLSCSVVCKTWNVDFYQFCGERMIKAQRGLSERGKVWRIVA